MYIFTLNWSTLPLQFYLKVASSFLLEYPTILILTLILTLTLTLIPNP